MAEPKPFDPTPESVLDPDFVAVLKTVTAHRARTVIDHILKYGFISNDDLKVTYGYEHPPRAIGDVRDNGIPVLTHKTRSAVTGRLIGAYTFGDPSNVQGGRLGGRRPFPKQFKQALIAKYGAADAITGERLEDRYLQIDHRVPYRVAGDGGALDEADFMLLDASSQRQKSWSCEHCPNMVSTRAVDVCKTCFWASPENYLHVATEKKRRIDLAWAGDDVAEYDRLAREAGRLGIDTRALIRQSYAIKRSS